MTKTGLVAFRDPLGLRPLCLGSLPSNGTDQQGLGKKGKGGEGKGKGGEGEAFFFFSFLIISNYYFPQGMWLRLRPVPWELWVLIF